MIRFVDLTQVYWSGEETEPVCAFLNTVTDSFIATATGAHVCTCIDDVADVENANAMTPGRLLGYVPAGFFE